MEHFKQSAIGIGLVHEPVKVAQMVAAAKQSEHNATEQVNYFIVP